MNNQVLQRVVLIKNREVVHGQLLYLQPEVQHLALVDSKDVADEAYTYEQALNPAEIGASLFR